MNILVLAAGQANNELEKGEYPSYLLEMRGITVLQYIIEACLKLKRHHFTIVFRKQDMDAYQLERITALLDPRIKILAVENETRGAACTALLAMRYINNHDELLIVNANELIEIDFLEVVTSFQQRQFDAGVVTFSSVHPRYSYVYLNEDEWVVEVEEKKPISRHAIAGFYWFARGEDFVRSAQNMIRKDVLVNDFFYISPVLNEMVLQHFKIGIFRIEANQYHPLKTKQQMLQFESAAKF